MRLLYSSISETEAAQKAFADYDNSQQLRALVFGAGRIDSKLSHLYTLPLSSRATASVLFSGNPADGETIIVSSITYRFKTTGAAAYDVTRGSSATATAINFARALNASSQGGYYAGTEINPDVEATAETVSVPLRVRFGGTAGNVLTVSSTSSALTITAFSGGASDYSQLATINQLLGHSLLVRGQNRSTGQNQSADLPEDYYKMAMAMLDALASGAEALIEDSTGAAVAMSDGMLPDSDTRLYIPPVDEGDPLAWGHDIDRDYSEDREL